MGGKKIDRMGKKLIRCEEGRVDAGKNGMETETRRNGTGRKWWRNNYVNKI